MLSRVLLDLEERGRRPSLDLAVGMAGHEGLPRRDHRAFLDLASMYEKQASVAYTRTDTSDHSKIYIWLTAGEPVRAFAGSSNFTQNGFRIGRRRDRHGEVLVEVDPRAAEGEFQRVHSAAIAADSPDVERFVNLDRRRDWSRPTAPRSARRSTARDGGREVNAELILPLVALSTSTKGTVRGGVHTTWGLNWGQRGSRDRDQATIPYPKRAKEIAPGFFPVGVAGDRPQFLVTTDDEQELFMVVAEQGDKGLHSVPSNASLGRYFRRRLGLPEGAVVRDADLRRFGSRFVRFTRLDDESYLMEFDPSIEAEGRALYGI